MKRKAKRMLELHTEIKELEKDMQSVLDAEGYTLSTASGCGVVLSATIVGEIGDIARFKSPASLASMQGAHLESILAGRRRDTERPRVAIDD